MNGKRAKLLRKLAGLEKSPKEETRSKVSGQRRIGYIDGTGKGNHRVEEVNTYTWIAGPRKRLYRLMKKYHKDPQMMEMLVSAETQITNEGENNE